MGDPHRETQHAGSLLDAAMALHRQGRLGEAEAAYLRVPAGVPQQADALHGLGIIALQRAQPSSAVDLITSALALSDSDPHMHANLARALSEMGRPLEALERLDQAIARNPRFTAALINRGNLLLELSRPAEALSCFEHAAQLDPRDAKAFNGAANAWLDLNQPAQALAAFSTAITLQPDEPLFLVNRALAFRQLNRSDEALQDCRLAKALGDATAQLLFVEANALLDLGHSAQALSSFDSALALEPRSAKILNGRGVALLALARPEAALQSFESCLQQSNPSGSSSAILVQARFNRVTALKELGRRSEALQALEELAAAAPDLTHVRGALLHERLSQGDWRGYSQAVDATVHAVDRGVAAAAPFEFLAITDSPSAQLRCARLHVASYLGLPSAPWRPWQRERHERLKIAYLSGDLHNHATAQLAAGLFEMHDRSRFEVAGISFGPDDGSALRSRLAHAFEHFVDVRGLSESAVIELLEHFEVDIAVDLKGYTYRSRPSLLARRVAPIQVSYLGYPGTLGVDWMDYLIADSVVIPEEEIRHYSEAVVWMPRCYQVNDSARPYPMSRPTRAEVGLPEASLVLCCFNASYKLNPPMFDIWMRLLQSVPSAVLWLLEDLPGFADRLRAECAARGVDPSRLVFAPRTDPIRYLERQPLADLFLDTLPCNAHTTCSDALWMGVPVLTCAGRAFASRVAASIVSTAGFPELVTDSLVDYERRALELLRAPEKLRQLRDRLLNGRNTHPLFDTGQFCRDLESAYERMWMRHQAGLPPESLRLCAQGPVGGDPGGIPGVGAAGEVRIATY